MDRATFESRDPEAAADLFTADAARYQEGIEFSHENLATTENAGFAHWGSWFTRFTSSSAVELDADGKRTEFRERWHKTG